MTTSADSMFSPRPAPRPGAVAALLRTAGNALSARPAVASRAPSGGTAERRFDDAFTLFELGRWPQAFELLAPLADAGHPQAARLALLMARRGSALFGGRYAASAERRRCWARISD